MDNIANFLEECKRLGADTFDTTDLSLWRRTRLREFTVGFEHVGENGCLAKTKRSSNLPRSVALFREHSRSFRIGVSETRPSNESINVKRVDITLGRRYEARNLNPVVQCLYSLSTAIMKSVPDYHGPRESPEPDFFVEGHSNFSKLTCTPALRL